MKRHTFVPVFVVLVACSSQTDSQLSTADAAAGDAGGPDAPPGDTARACRLDSAPQASGACTGHAPCNPHLARTPWPTYHLNGYAQASTDLPGLTACDDVEVQTLTLPEDAAGSSWLVLSEAYPDGARAVWGSAGGTSIFKARLTKEAIELVDTYSLGRRAETPALRRSVAFNMRFLPGGVFFTPDTARRRLLRLRDADPTSSRSPIVLEKEWALPDEIDGEPVQLRETYDGWTIFITDKGHAGAVKDDFSEHRTLDLNTTIGDESCIQNGFPIDEDGGVYVSCFRQMVKLRWRNTRLEVEWKVPYDFLGPGCASTKWTGFYPVGARVLLGDTCTGSGTTATLLGGPKDPDALVVVTDGHSPRNHLVAFWRDEIPAGWPGLPGHDRRVAGVLELPHGSPDGPSFTIQNSPAALGYDVFVAAWAGPNLGCDPPKGVQAARWLPETNSLTLLWNQPGVSFNGVPTVSAATNLVYSSGREGCGFVLRGLDLLTGAVVLSVPMGEDETFKDPGNQLVVSDDRSMLFSGAHGVVRLRPR